MKRLATLAAATALLGLGVVTTARSEARAKAPTIVLVHGAFAGASSWNPVIDELVRDGYPVIAAANPLRTLKGDADYVARIAASVDGPVILVGHSYGGEVISMAAHGSTNIAGLVFVAGLAPDVGESASSLGGKFPTGTLGQALAPPIVQADGGHDLYIAQSKYWSQFAADLPKAMATQMAVTQRPVPQETLAEPAGPGAWKTLPTFFIWGSRDKNIPAALHAFLAKRARAREAVEVKGASHVVMLSHPHAVAALIERAAASR